MLRFQNKGRQERREQLAWFHLVIVRYGASSAGKQYEEERDHRDAQQPRKAVCGGGGAEVRQGGTEVTLTYVP